MYACLCVCENTLAHANIQLRTLTNHYMSLLNVSSRTTYVLSILQETRKENYNNVNNIPKHSNVGNRFLLKHVKVML